MQPQAYDELVAVANETLTDRAARAFRQALTEQHSDVVWVRVREHERAGRPVPPTLPRDIDRRLRGPDDVDSVGNLDQVSLAA
jgi:hypothetical protein